jgi:hypothetical protein
MANTMTLIASSTVGSGGASSIDFTSIPSTYTDLCLKFSNRSSATNIGDSMQIAFNGSTANITTRYIEGTGAAAASGSSISFNGAYQSNGATANTFGNWEIYIPNYAGSANKSYSIDNVIENNATTAYADLVAGLWSQTAAINRITLSAPSFNWLQYTAAYLYGVNNA